MYTVVYIIGIVQSAKYLGITAPIAQLVEPPLLEWEVVGSNPDRTHIKRVKNGTSSSLAEACIKVLC